MRAEPAQLDAGTGPWAARRTRAEELLGQHAFAAELLELYLALLPVQEDAWHAARESAPPAQELARWAAERVVPAVVDATVAAGPAALGEVVRRRAEEGAWDMLAAWLAGVELDPVERYVARASLAPVLEVVDGWAGGERAAEREGRTGAHCPRCGGQPQLSVVADPGEALVSGRRSLICARCAWGWEYARSACPACGERDEKRLLVYAEHWGGPVGGNGDGAEDVPAVFPHLRIVACETCRRYLIEVDLAHDGRAVPEVDELAALPLDLYAADQGLRKLTPNLMGF